MAQIAGKVVLITGVGSGIGRAAARLFAQQGALVLGVDRDGAALQALTAELQGLGQGFEPHVADLSTPEAAAQTVARCLEVFGGLDVLYNNVGISVVEPFATVTPATLERILAVNFLSVFYLCQQAIPALLQQEAGVIINTASELAIVAQPLYSAYCASKGAVLAFTRALALEYAHTNLRINALCPGPIDTPMLQQEFETEPDPVQARQAGIATMPIGRLGTPEEIAEVALFLASGAPRLLHGSALVVDGAKTIL